jgi:uncharacterized protein YybS (DUF2232 family)
MDSHRITPLTEGGLLAALTVVIAIASVYVPLVGPFIALLWPLPLAVLVLRHGMRQGFMAMLVAGAALAMLIEPMIALRLAAAYGPLGLMLGYGYRKGLSGLKLFPLAFLAAVAGELVVLGLIFAVFGNNPFAMLMDGLKSAFDSTFALYEQAGMPAEEIEAGRAQIDTGLLLMSQLGPLLIVLLGLLDAGAAFFFGGKILHRLGHEVPQLPPFADWRLPKAFAYLFGFAMVGLYWGGTRQIEWLYQAALNADMLALFAGLIQGLALMAAVMNKFKVNGFWRWLFYILILINGLFAQILAFTGLFDMVFDYRRRFSRRNGD